MKNFKAVRSGRDGELKYEYCTVEEGKGVEIRLSYSKDEHAHVKRGIKLSVNTVEIQKQNGYEICTYDDIMGGMRAHVLTLARKSDKALTYAAEWFDPKLPILAAKWEELGKEGFVPGMLAVIDVFNQPDHERYAGSGAASLEVAQ